MWSAGSAWRVVDGLQVLNAQIREKYPRAVPPATDVNSWGSIADDAHSASSDHYPHYYSGLGSEAVVCARDFPHAPELGLDAGVVTEHMRQARDPRVKYIIFNRRITGVSYGWTWHEFTGDDPHKTHFHVSSVHTAAADGMQAWSLPGAAVAPAPKIGADMQLVVKFSDRPETFVTDGITSRWLPDGAAVQHTLELGSNNWLSLGNTVHGNTVCVLGPEQKGILGVIMNADEMDPASPFAQ